MLIAGTFYDDLWSLLEVQFKVGLRVGGAEPFIADTDSIGLPVSELETCAVMLAGLGLAAFAACRVAWTAALP